MEIMVAGNKPYTDDYIRDILDSTKTIAMVGASNNPERPSNRVMQYLLAAGFRVIPVNPGIGAEGLFGQTAYASLKDIPDQVDMVDIFRRSDAVASIVDELHQLLRVREFATCGCNSFFSTCNLPFALAMPGSL
jgi:predicted CoA-binding protein